MERPAPVFWLRGVYSVVSHLELGIVIPVGSDADLLQVVLALGPGRRFADLLDGREEQPDEDCDDGDHDEELDESERRSGETAFGHVGLQKKTVKREKMGNLLIPFTKVADEAPKCK